VLFFWVGVVQFVDLCCLVYGFVLLFVFKSSVQFVVCVVQIHGFVIFIGSGW
jgi:hypothetical protein